MVARADLVRDLRALGLAEGSAVLVHMSMRSIGRVEGGAPTVIAALREAVGSEGTVLFPTLTGNPSCSPDNPPCFDARSTPSPHMGVVAETARQMPEAVRSLSPTHSVAAIGAQARWLCEGHRFSPTPCGPGSPYERLGEIGGKILLIGVSHQCNTSLHMVEEEAGLDYHMLAGSGATQVIDLDGVPHQVLARFHRYGVDRDFDRIVPLLQANGAETVGRIGQAVARLVDAAAMRRLVLEALRECPCLLLRI